MRFLGGLGEEVVRELKGEKGRGGEVMLNRVERGLVELYKGGIAVKERGVAGVGGAARLGAVLVEVARAMVKCGDLGRCIVAEVDLIFLSFFSFFLF